MWNVRAAAVSVSLLAVAAGSSDARAALAFTAGQTSFAVSPGDSIDVPIYLSESAPGSEVSGDGGLFSAGFSVTQVAPLPTSSATITGLASNTTLFDVVNNSTYDDGVASLSVDQSGGTIATAAMPSGGLLLIGTVTIVAPAVADQVIHFSIGDFDPATTQTITYNATELDAIIQAGSFSVTTAVPEPGVVGTVTLTGMATLRRRRRL